ncbi:MAG: hypothetical protein EXR76_02655 [Myxococcales bacterium]|nr:hypothetical protein [Myxococcales bacterium]
MAARFSPLSMFLCAPLAFACVDVDVPDASPHGRTEPLPERRSYPAPSPPDRPNGASPSPALPLWSVGGTSPVGQPAGAFGTAGPQTLTVLEAPPLPPAWPRDLDPPLGTSVDRWVVATTEVVGLRFSAGARRVFDRTGGLFLADPGRFTPQRAPASHALTHVEENDRQVVLCAGDERLALYSDDAGQSFTALPFTCGDEGRRTVALSGARIFALAEGRTLLSVEVSAESPPVVESFALPFEGALALSALGTEVVVLGPTDAARSRDGGHTFESLSFDHPGLPSRVVDVRHLDKDRVVAVGLGDREQRSPVARLVHRAFLPAQYVPRPLHELASLAVTADARLFAVPAGPGGAVVSEDGGRTWQRVNEASEARGLITSAGRGFVSAGGQPILSSNAEPFVPATPIPRPLLAVVYTHPRIAVGVTIDGRLVRSDDGGRLWHGLAAAPRTGYLDLDTAGGHRIVAVGLDHLFQGEQAGASATVVDLPCRPLWVRAVDEGRSFVGCNDGQWLDVVGAAVRALDLTAVGGLLDTDRLLRPSLRPSGEFVAVVEGSGSLLIGQASAPPATWTLVSAPIGDDVLLSVSSGLTESAAVTRGGAVYRFVVASASWQLLAAPGSIARPGQSLLTRGGVLLVTGADGLYRIKTRGSPDLLGYAPGAFGLAATGDGALLVLQSRQSTLLTTR